MTLGFGLFIDLPATTSWPRIILYQIVAGIGVGPNFQAPLIALQTLVPKRDIATATATFGFVRNLATSVSVVIGGVVFQNGMRDKLRSLQTSLGPEVADALGGGSAGANTATVARLPMAQRAVATQAYTGSLRTMWILYVVVSAFGLAVSLAIGKQVLSSQHEVTKTGLDGLEAERRKEKAARVGVGREKGEEV